MCVYTFVYVRLRVGLLVFVGVKIENFIGKKKNIDFQRIICFVCIYSEYLTYMGSERRHILNGLNRIQTEYIISNQFVELATLKF